LVNLGAYAKVVNLGSCFAKNLAKELSALGTATEHICFAEILNSTYANGYLLDWLYETSDAMEHYKDFSLYFSNLDKVATRRIFDETDLFVCTLGVWHRAFSEPSPDALLAIRTIQKSACRVFTKRYNFRTKTVDEFFTIF
jgi:hypothetical protein